MEQRRSACDACRRRRVRCDSSQPCRRCVDSGVTCTYGSVVGRASATSYARNLEQQIAELHARLRQIQPLSSTASSTSSRREESPQEHGVDKLVQPGDDYVFDQATGRRVYRYSSGLNLLRAVADMVGVGADIVQLGHAIFVALETPPMLSARAPLDWISALLPPEQEMHEKIMLALDKGLICHGFIDQDALLLRVSSLFHGPLRTSMTDRKPFLALVYALLALGERYMAPANTAEDAPLEKLESGASPKGLYYFRASVSIVNEERDRCDLDIVQALLIHTRYLLTISTFSDAYTSLSSAISNAMHLGLHLDDASLRSYFSERELYDRRRVFAVIYDMEMSLAFTLGLPRTLAQSEPRQILGLRDDEFADLGWGTIASNPTSSRAETLMAQKLYTIYAKIADHQAQQSDSQWVSTQWTSDVETDLAQWQTALLELPDISHDRRALLGQLVLRLIFAAAEFRLYSPCLHHLGRDRSDPKYSAAGFEYGSACIRAATKVVLLVETLASEHIMDEAYWLHGYLLIWAATMLAYFVLYSKTRVTIEASKSAALRARDLLHVLGATNITAKHLWECINPCIEVISAMEL